MTRASLALLRADVAEARRQNALWTGTVAVAAGVTAAMAARGQRPTRDRLREWWRATRPSTKWLVGTASFCAVWAWNIRRWE